MVHAQFVETSNTVYFCLSEISRQPNAFPMLASLVIVYVIYILTLAIFVSFYHPLYKSIIFSTFYA